MRSWFHPRVQTLILSRIEALLHTCACVHRRVWIALAFIVHGTGGYTPLERQLAMSKHH